jgi:DNA-binding transcriptional MocR family regulator
MVRELVENDPAVKGIWCVPKFSNPTGIVYSPETVFAFAALNPAAPDFRIYWDNAYCVHFLYDDDHPFIPEILSECEKAGHPDMVFKFASCSKITFGGSGISAMASSKNKLDDVKKTLTVQTIGHDKMNQLRHARFLKDHDNVIEHMKMHAAILRPKFELLENTLDNELLSRGIGNYFKPKGGYFISFDSLPGCAKEIVSRAKKAGVTMTGAGATWPYGRDPRDSNIRVAPTLPPLEDLKIAAELFCLCVKIVSLEKLLGQ